MLFVKYASILLQAITIQLDEAFLYAVLDLTKLQGVDWEAESEKWVIMITTFNLFSLLLYLIVCSSSTRILSQSQ